MPLGSGGLLLVGVLVFALALATAKSTFGAVPEGTTYYVSAGGNDGNDGRSPETAWQTLAKVATVALQPGDAVLLRGGDTFDGTLKTASSGKDGAPILFTSFGAGKARIVGPAGGAAVYLNSNRFLTFSSLDVSASGASCVLSSMNGTGSSDVVLDGLDIHDCGDAGLNGDNPADARLTLVNSTVTNTQGCGVIFRGAGFRITEDVIQNTGVNATGSLTYPLHGIYAKGPGPTITDNTIVDFQTAGITIRSTGSDVEHNVVEARARGRRGISYYQETDVPGVTRIVGNTISGVSRQGIAIDHGSTTAAFGGAATTASTSENFVLVGNAVAMRGGADPETVEGIRLLRVPSAVMSGNRVSGTLSRPYIAYSPTERYSERGNHWQARPSRRVFFWNGAPMRFSRYAAASGQGSGDRLF